MGNKQVISRLNDSYFITLVQEDLKFTEYRLDMGLGVYFEEWLSLL